MGATIVVPCFDEEQRLDIDAFSRSRDTMSFVFVDDGSTDRTLEMLDELRSCDPGRFDLVHLRRNRGKGEAVRQGMLRAIGTGTPIVGYLDADLSTPLEEMERLIRIILSTSGVHGLFGSRVRLLGHQIERRPFRHFGGRVFAALTTAVLRLPLYDTQCGAKVFRNSATTLAAFEEPFASRWIFDVELIGRLAQALHQAGQDPWQALREAPLEHWSDVSGSKLGVLDGFRAFADLLRIRRRLGGPVAFDP